MEDIQLQEASITCVAQCRKGKTEGLLMRGSKVRIIIEQPDGAPGPEEIIVLDEELEVDSNVKLGCEIAVLSGVV